MTNPPIFSILQIDKGMSHRKLCKALNFGNHYRRCKMKKLLTTVLGLLLGVLLINGCGTDVEGCEGCLDDFFNNYYSECIIYCDTCAEWAEMCDLDYDANACVSKRWTRGSPNESCEAATKEKVTPMIEDKDCNMRMYLWHCLNFQ